MDVNDTSATTFFSVRLETIRAACVFYIAVVEIEFPGIISNIFNDIRRLIIEFRKMPSTILRTDNSAIMSGIKPSVLTGQPEQVFHYKYEILMNL